MNLLRLILFLGVVNLEVASGRNCQCRSRLQDIETVLDVSPVSPRAIPQDETSREEPEQEPSGKPSGDSGDSGDPVIEFAPSVPVSETSKHLNIVNSCSFAVELGVTGSDKGPSAHGTCPDNQIDNGKGRCFWYLKNLPDTLNPGEEWGVSLDSKDEHVFSGNVWGVKAGLMTSACPAGKCSPWVGARGAVTKAEFTFSKTGTDFFDISIIEGANIPLAMYPLDVKPDSDDRYRCGVAGGCPWTFDPEPDLRKYVTEVIPPDAETRCEKDSECSGSSVCGATFESPPNYGVCGSFNGYASAHVSCLSGSTGPPFFCEDNSDVISCMGDYNLSGYNQPPGTKVCGCPDWVKWGIDAPTHVPCETTDKNWEEKSLPFLKFLKRGCPLGYVFGFDDFTGVATCSASTAYKIEFCPDDSEQNFYKN